MEKPQLNNARMGSPAAALPSSTAAVEDDDASLFDLELRSATTEEFIDEKNIIDRDGALISDLIFSSSPSDGLFFKGRLSPLDPSTAPTSKSSGGKLRILMLGLKNPHPADAAQKLPERKRQNRFVLKEVPLVSLFTRDGGSGRRAKVHAGDGGGGSPPPSPAEKRPSDALQRYLSKIKPFYVRVSKRYSEKIKSSNPMSSPGDPAARSKSFPAPSAGGLKVVARRLGKSRSASAAATAPRSPPATAVPVRRRDDTLLEQQDGIQSAIAHCKRSLERSP